MKIKVGYQEELVECEERDIRRFNLMDQLMDDDVDDEILDLSAYIHSKPTFEICLFIVKHFHMKEDYEYLILTKDDPNTMSEWWTMTNTIDYIIDDVFQRKDANDNVSERFYNIYEFAKYWGCDDLLECLSFRLALYFKNMSPEEIAQFWGNHGKSESDSDEEETNP